MGGPNRSPFGIWRTDYDNWMADYDCQEMMDGMMKWESFNVYTRQQNMDD